MSRKDWFIFAIIIFGIWIFFYFIGVFSSLEKRGKVTQSYWYCSINMVNEEHDMVNFPHHYGHKPLIPFSDHLCGDNELEKARSFGWSQYEK